MQTYAALEHLVAQLVLRLSMQMSTQTTNTVLPWRRALLALPLVCTLHSPSLTPYILPYIQMFTLVKGGTVFHTLVLNTECHCISGIVSSLFLYLVSLHLTSLYAPSCITIGVYTCSPSLMNCTQYTLQASPCPLHLILLLCHMLLRSTSA